MQILYFFGPTVDGYDTVAEMYSTIISWAVVFSPFVFLNVILSFALGIKLVGLVRFKVTILSIITSTAFAIIIGGIYVNLIGGHLSDVILTRLSQMFIMLGVTFGTYTFFRVFRKNRRDVTRSQLELRIQELSFIRQLGFLSLLFWIIQEIYNYGVGYNELYNIKVLLYFPLVFYIGYRISISKVKVSPPIKGKTERFYTVLILIIILIQLVLLPFQVGDVLCKIPLLGKQFKCQSYHLWEWQQDEIEKKRKEWIENEIKKKKNEEERMIQNMQTAQLEEKKGIVQVVPKPMAYKKDSSNYQHIGIGDDLMELYLSIARELSTFSKSSKPIALKKFESEINSLLKPIRDASIKRGEKTMNLIEPKSVNLGRIRKEFETAGFMSFPDLYYYLLSTHIPHPSVDSFRITDQYEMIDDFYQGFENGIVFKYDYLPEQGDSFYCLIPTDDITWVRELMAYLLKDFNENDDLFEEHRWITPDYFGSGGIGCYYRLIETDFGILITNYCGC